MKSPIDIILSRKDLGFWQLPERESIWRESQQFAGRLKEHADHLVVLGMGGSALGGKCLVECLGEHPTRVTFLANSDPTDFARVLGASELLESAHFLAVSKSGTTLELACMLDVLLPRLNARNISSRLSVITEPANSDGVKNPLRRWAEEKSLHIIDHPLDVGGRFSALTPVGLIPAAFAGVKLHELRMGAQRAVAERKVVDDWAAKFFESFKRGEVITAFWSYVDELHSFLPWLQQLWAESLGKGKKRNGEHCSIATSVPVAYEGTCDQHSVLQQLMEGVTPTAIVFIRDKQKQSSGPELNGETIDGYSYLKSYRLGEVFDTQSRSTEQALKEAGRTTMSLEIPDFSASTLGYLMMTFELVVGALGELLDVDVFNQPGVELGKKITKTKLQSATR